MSTQRQNHPKHGGFRARPTATRLKIRRLHDRIKALTEGSIATKELLIDFTPVKAAQLSKRIFFLNESPDHPRILFLDRTANRPTKTLDFPGPRRAWRERATWIDISDEVGRIVSLSFRGYEDLLWFLAFTIARYNYQ